MSAVAAMLVLEKPNQKSQQVCLLIYKYSLKLPGADFNATNMFSAEGKYYYFNANPVSEFCTL
jgi:hypothetical protein